MSALTKNGVRKLVLILVAAGVFAVIASSPWWVPEALMAWTDYLVRHSIKHVARTTGQRATSDDYWYAAADLAYYITALITFLGIAGTGAVILYGARQVNLATSNMRSSARLQQMRLLFDLDIALLDNPEIFALAEGHFQLDAVTRARAKSNAFANAFLNGCDTIHDYYTAIDPGESDRYWRAWEAQLAYYLPRRPELRAVARDNLSRGFYTDRFRTELKRLLEAAEKQPDARGTMPSITVVESDAVPEDIPTLRELSDSEADAAALRLFYESVYVREFPDPDERESLANLENYLRVKKPERWYGKNNYHIVVGELAGRNAALCVADYVAEANMGIIEFLVVVPEARGRGLGRRMLEYLQGLLVADAHRAHGTHLRGIVAEMNDPFRAPRGIA